jgi:hypothetical protein
VLDLGAGQLELRFGGGGSGLLALGLLANGSCKLLEAVDVGPCLAELAACVVGGVLEVGGCYSCKGQLVRELLEAVGLLADDEGKGGGGALLALDAGLCGLRAERCLSNVDAATKLDAHEGA